jgi:hypothetical protein
MRSWSADGDEPLGGGAHGASAAETSNRLIVEDDAELRSLTAALFEDEQVETIDCRPASLT